MRTGSGLCTVQDRSTSGNPGTLVLVGDFENFDAMSVRRIDLPSFGIYDAETAQPDNIAAALVAQAEHVVRRAGSAPT